MKTSNLEAAELKCALDQTKFRQADDAHVEFHACPQQFSDEDWLMKEADLWNKRELARRQMEISGARLVELSAL
jgi:hypothetical protein